MAEHGGELGPGHFCPMRTPLMGFCPGAPCWVGLSLSDLCLSLLNPVSSPFSFTGRLSQHLLPGGPGLTQGALGAGFLWEGEL